MIKMKKSFRFIAIILSIAWLLFLFRTDSYYSIYLILGINSIYYYSISHKCITQTEISKEKKAAIIFSLLFSITVTCGNYKIFINNIYALIFIFFGGLFVGVSLYMTLSSIINKILKKYQRNDTLNTKKLFLFSFFLILTIDLFYLFFVAYPGNVSTDSISQIKQIMTGVYSNHHPYWHTRLMGLFINLGISIFGNINAGIAFFSVFQILFVALCFSYIVLSVWQFTKSKKATIFSLIFIAFMPYNICYSCTLWKDVIFSMCVAVFITVLARIIRLDNSPVNYLILILSGIGFGLFRSNGWLALILSFIFICFFLKKGDKRIIITLSSVIIFTGILRGPILKNLKVQSTESAESLSIPIQQISRVVYDGNDLSAEQEKLVNKLVTTNEIKTRYKPYISDPIKTIINTSKEKSNYLSEHKADYLKLWISVGLKYPGEYLKAWIDQTKGYWNGGYNYWVVASYVEKNSYGIQRIVKIPLFEVLFYYYLNLFNLPVIKLFTSIGFNIWLVMFIIIHGISNKNKTTLSLVPLIGIWGTLLVATPVFCEFRYIYCLFTTLPIIATFPFLLMDQ